MLFLPLYGSWWARVPRRYLVGTTTAGVNTIFLLLWLLSSRPYEIELIDAKTKAHDAIAAWTKNNTHLVGETQTAFGTSVRSLDRPVTEAQDKVEDQIKKVEGEIAGEVVTDKKGNRTPSGTIGDGPRAKAKRDALAEYKELLKNAKAYRDTEKTRLTTIRDLAIQNIAVQLTAETARIRDNLKIQVEEITHRMERTIGAGPKTGILDRHRALGILTAEHTLFMLTILAVCFTLENIAPIMRGTVSLEDYRLAVEDEIRERTEPARNNRNVTKATARRAAAEEESDISNAMAALHARQAKEIGDLENGGAPHSVIDDRKAQHEREVAELIQRMRNET
jgi:hypothetical protein